MSPGSDWRDDAASGVLADWLLTGPDLPTAPPRALVLRDGSGHAGRALEARGLQVVRWHRLALPGLDASPWPPPGPFPLAALRLPPARAELEMSLHQAASALSPRGTILLFGASDEGVKSAPARMADLFEDVETVVIRHRCRVIRGRLREGLPQGATPAGVRVRTPLDAWAIRFDVELPDGPRRWTCFPGLFAHGGVDPGTRLLLDHLPRLPPGARALDFGCGSGLLGAALGARCPGVEVDFLDVDTVALEAVRINVPEATTILADRIPPGGPPYRAIVGNPPYHTGKEETLLAIGLLVDGARSRLERKGELRIVVQRRLPAERLLTGAFRSVRVVADRDEYRVWSARGPGR